MRITRHRRWLAGVGAVVTAAAVALSTTFTASAAAAGCSVKYTVGSQWQGGFSANVAITNLGDPLTSWTVTWTFTTGQRVTQGWNATYSQSGGQVTARSASWNGDLGTGATAAIGFNGSWAGSNPAPTDFAVNGVACNGTASPAPTTASPSVSPTGGTGSLPNSFRWNSSAQLIGPKSDATHNLVSVKDPSIVYHNGRYHLFVSTVNTNQGYNMAYLNFTDFPQAAAAPLHYLDQTPIGTGYKTAPQVFYFAPQQRWYLIFQIGNNVAYSTNTEVSNPQGWTAPRSFYASTPQIVLDNLGNGQWLDFWNICDAAKCYMFSSDDNGHLYRAETTVANFPNGFSQPVIAMQDSNRFWLFEAANVYKLAGTNQYLLLVEAIGQGRRMFRSWTAPALTGPWTPLADTLANPFARHNNVTPPGGTVWTNDYSHGEMIRSGIDQTLTISPCRLRFLYQGMDPSSTGPYNLLPWRLGLLTQTNSTC